MFLSAITVAELRAGVALLPAGKQQTALQKSLETQVLPLFAGRVLSFDPSCTAACAQLLGKARGLGLAISAVNGWMAATATPYGFIVASPDVGPFRAAGTVVINPWLA